MNRPLSVRRAGLAIAALVLSGMAAACSSSPGTPASGSSSGPGQTPAVTGTVTVFAASSLKETFTSIAKRFEAAHPGTTVVLSFAASSALATQITSGAPADVFASASAKDMATLTSAGAATAPTTFATNSLTVVVPSANPAQIASLADLARAGVKVAQCQAAVPCGVLAAKVLATAGLTVTPATLEPDVKSVLTKVRLGEVDAGLVYVTDAVAAAGSVTAVPIPAGVNATTAYPIAALSHAANPAGARAFVDAVVSAEGLAVLKAAGFGAP
jgi:molybdate transport system substrate-binding protein